jgi:hypothetical protein
MSDAPQIPDYGNYQKPKDEDLLVRIAETAKLQIEAEEIVQRCEHELKEAKQRLKFIDETQLPELMVEAQQKRLVTADGIQVDLKEDLYARVKEDKNEEAMQWLRDNNLAAIIKNGLTIYFGKNDDEFAERVIELLKGFERQIPFERKETVHWRVLENSLNELLDDSDIEVPKDLFNYYERKKTKLKVSSKI